ncbi:InlB B-repeat-containing protein [Desulfonatronum thioautotrophicum]|uniref:InlB B-repeat-containing protein n=1 Tax=Desulfonatronum thioautotrophicum TaxID=617001 RepID=UPI0005EB035F|nr:DUF1566 domain-containing protein [Desulfonatronum thioautotrophicum]
MQNILSTPRLLSLGFILAGLVFFGILNPTQITVSATQAEFGGEIGIPSADFGRTPSAAPRVQGPVVQTPAQAYSHGDPTDAEQFLLEIVNWMRAEPELAGEYYEIDLNDGLAPGTITNTPKAPLAFHPGLIAAARGHTQWMLDEKDESKIGHTGQDGSTPGNRMVKAGYSSEEAFSAWAENIGWYTTEEPLNEGDLLYIVVANLFRSSGHRANTLAENVEEAGFGVIPVSYDGFNALMVTQKFAASAATPTPMLVGVVYEDLDQNGLYDMGEGLSGMTVMPDRGGYYAVTSASGGFAIPVQGMSGPLNLTVSGGIYGTLTRQVTLTGNNIKVDFILSRTDQHTVSTSANPVAGGTTAGDADYPSGSAATVRATPSSGYAFVNWTENGIQVSTSPTHSFTVSGDHLLVANFEPIHYDISTSSNPVAGGTTTGDAGYPSGALATVRATPNSGYAFVNWTENGIQASINPTLSFTVSGDRHLVANFSETPPAPFAGGDGSESDPYLVTTALQLNNLRGHPNAFFKLSTDIDLGDSPWSQGAGWEPIVTEGTGEPFSGHFDGNGHIIRNLTINRPGAANQGLFGSLRSATIRNVVLEDYSIIGGPLAGGVAGKAEDSRIENVQVSGEVSGDNDVGGVVGALTGGGLDFVHGTVSVRGASRTGGLAGHVSEAVIQRSSSLGSVQGDFFVGGLAGLVGESQGGAQAFLPGVAAPLTTEFEQRVATSPSGQAIEVALDDATSVSIPALPGGYEVSLARTDNDLPVTTQLHDQTALTASGAVRRFTISGSGDPAGLTPVITIPGSEAGSINPETLSVLRIGKAIVDGDTLEDHAAVLPVSMDAEGNLRFVDHLMPYGLNAIQSGGQSGPMRAYSGGAGGSWEGQADYVVMSFQDDLNWRRQPQLVRMVPDPSNAAGGYRRPATAEELSEMSKQPICNFVLLVHGHNEEEKEGSYSPTAPAPWLFSYKRLVWDLFFREVAQKEQSEDGEEAIYPYECTAFYEFIYPTYRPIFSPVPDKSGIRHETLGESLGLAIQREFATNAQLKSMVQANMPFNAIIVAHSQGGLVARAGLRNMPQEFKDKVVRLVTWGSPHHGAALYTLRYAFQSGQDMILDGRRLPLQRINNSWVAGSRFVDLLNANVALDAPGIRDLRWDVSKKDMTRTYELFPGLMDIEAEQSGSIPVFSDNLAVFNAGANQELTTGGYSFFVGKTSKRTTLEVQELLYIIYELMYFAESTSIEQGATLNDIMMKESYRINDGAVPLYSQQAQGVGFNVPTVIVNMGDADHEEFYGAEPGQRTPEALAIGRETARETFDQVELQHPSRGCPTLEALMHYDADPESDRILITGQVIFPLYEPEHGGDGRVGRRIERVEARRVSRLGHVIEPFTFTHKDDGAFEGEIASQSLPDVPIVLVAVLKDGSEVVGIPDQVSVSILPPRILIFELAPGATEAEHEFEASASPEGVYRFDWDFDDGSPIVSRYPGPGERSSVSHTYANLSADQQFRPTVRLYGEDGELLARDTILIRVDEQEEPQGRFTDHGDGTVTDHHTGLMWRKDRQIFLQWQAAVEYCRQAFAGYYDWRLPHIERQDGPGGPQRPAELDRILGDMLDLERDNNWPFNVWPGSPGIWSATTWEPHDGYAWYAVTRGWLQPANYFREHKLERKSAWCVRDAGR